MVLIGIREVEVESALSELGIEVLEGGKNLLCRCPFHEDRHRSFAINAENGAWICYAGCGEGGLVGLVSQVLDVDAASAKIWLGNRGEVSGSEDRVLRMIDAPEEVGVEAVVPEFSYERGSTYSYMFNRGFTKDTLKTWSVGKDPEAHAVVLPVYFKKELLGLIRRHVYSEVTPPYLYTSGLPKSRLLFGWDQLLEAPSKIHITEGPMDAMRLSQNGYQAVAILGSRLSEAQVELLVGRTREVVLALDSDTEGVKGTYRAIDRLVGKVRTKVIRWPSGRKDANECSPNELLTNMGNPVEAALWASGVS